METSISDLEKIEACSLGHQESISGKQFHPCMSCFKGWVVCFHWGLYNAVLNQHFQIWKT